MQRNAKDTKLNISLHIYNIASTTVATLTDFAEETCTEIINYKPEIKTICQQRLQI